MASNNAGKVKEVNTILASSNITVVPQSTFNIASAEETGLSFVENALLKARHAATIAQCPTIADDSGIEVPALEGRPGIYSARYASEGASDEANYIKLLNELKKVPGSCHQARFVCVMVFIKHANDPVPIISQGIWEGRIASEPQGNHGFGYDPVFFVPTHNCTSAELSASVKDKLSHRGKALRQLVKLINTQI